MTRLLLLRFTLATLLGLAIVTVLGFPLPSAELTSASTAVPDVMRVALAVAAWIAVLLLLVGAVAEWVRGRRARGNLGPRLRTGHPGVLVLLTGVVLLVGGLVRSETTFSVCCGGQQTVDEALLHAR